MPASAGIKRHAWSQVQAERTKMAQLNTVIPDEIHGELHKRKIMSGLTLAECTTKVLEAGLKVEPQVPGNKKDK